MQLYTNETDNKEPIYVTHARVRDHEYSPSECYTVLQMNEESETNNADGLTMRSRSLVVEMQYHGEPEGAG